MKQFLIAAVILIVAVIGAVALVANRKSPPQRAPEERTPLVLTTAAQIESGNLSVSGSGTVRPRAEVNLSTQVAGKVTFVSPALVSGSFVREGEVLVTIDRSDFDNAVQQAMADVAQQEVAVLQAREESEIARAEYERFSDREALRAAAGAQGAAAEPGSLVFREPQLRAAEASLQRSRALLANAELAASRTIVRAPFSGFVRNKNVAEGSFLSPGQSFAQLVAADIYEIVIPMTREEAALIPDLWSARAGASKGASVFADYGGLRYRWPGYIDRAEAVLDPQTRTINVVVHVPNPISSGQLADDDVNVSGSGEQSRIVSSQAPPLLVGEFVTVELEGANLDRYIVLPRTALKSGDTVWVVRDGAIEIIPVQVLQQAEERAYIVSDAIGEGDQLVVSDLSVATPGMLVRTEADGNSGTD